MTKALTIRDKTAKIEKELAKLKENQLAAMGDNIATAVAQALATKQLRDLLTDDLVGYLSYLQNDPDGFKTDNDQGYPARIVKQCVITALLRGVQVVGNEFNIIAGNCYITKNGCQRIVNRITTSHKIGLSVPEMSEGRALVEARIEFTVEGRQEPIELHLRKTSESDERIPIRVNRKMGDDAVLGKARRKALARIIEYVSGLPVATEEDIAQEETIEAVEFSRERVTDFADEAAADEEFRAGELLPSSSQSSPYDAE